MRWVKRLLPVLLVAALGLGAWEWFTHSFHVSVGYCVEARFETAPADDQELCKWLESQPRMVPGKVLIGREGHDKKVLRVMFIRTPNLAGKPPFPDLEGACQDLGYGGPEFAFRDSVDRSISNVTSE